MEIAEIMNIILFVRNIFEVTPSRNTSSIQLKTTRNIHVNLITPPRMEMQL